MQVINIISEIKEVTYSLGRMTSKVNESIKYVMFDNGAKIAFNSIMSEIGNNKMAPWTEVEKIRKSKVDAKKMAFIQSLNDRLKETDLYKYSN